MGGVVQRSGDRDATSVGETEQSAGVEAAAAHGHAPAGVLGECGDQPCEAVPAGHGGVVEVNDETSRAGGGEDGLGKGGRHRSIEYAFEPEHRPSQTLTGGDPDCHRGDRTEANALMDPQFAG